MPDSPGIHVCNDSSVVTIYESMKSRSVNYNGALSKTVLITHDFRVCKNK